MPFHLPMNMRIALLLLGASAILTGVFAGNIIDFVDANMIPLLY